MAPLCYADVHVLQTVPPCNLNRDDAGTPKHALYGGVRRARVSSQAWKRATRLAFAAEMPREELGTRTKRIEELFAQQLAERSGLAPEQAERLAHLALEPLGIASGKKGDTAYLLFVGRRQVEELVDLVADRAGQLAQLEETDLKKQLKGLPVKDVLGRGHPLDVALFGRMVADLADLNVDAATQVAHAISTHPVEIEFDYFTAVDDENPREQTGAGMIGTVEFTSATFYRFATVGVHQLLENLGGDVDYTLRGLRLFIRSFVMSMPSGHQTSFAHRTLPDAVCVAIRRDQPVNLVTAFEEPVRADGSGVVRGSLQRLAAELLRVDRMWGCSPVQTLAVYPVPTDGDEAALLDEAFGEPRPFEEVVDRSVAKVAELLTGSD